MDKISIMQSLINKDKNFFEIMDMEIKANDIMEFLEYYEETLKLEVQYKLAITNRRTIAKEISKRMQVISAFNHLLSMDVDNKKSEYENMDVPIRDISKAMTLILSLANEFEDNYSMKILTTYNYGSFEVKDGTREDKEVGGNVFIIGKKDILDNMFTQEKYYDNSLRKLTDNIVQSGNSLVIAADYYFSSNITLPHYTSKISAIPNDIVGYIQDDGLQRAFNKFNGYIQENGTKIDDLDDKLLLNAMKKIKIKT